MQKKDENRNNWIDSMKGIAILGVFMTHFGSSIVFIKDNSFLSALFFFGARGVQIFFILSIYLAFYSYAKGNSGRSSARSDIGWIFKKIIRLAPLFWLSIAMSVLLFPSAQVSLGNILSTTLFFNAISPYWINSILSVNWYIAILVPMYYLIPLAYKKINNLQKAIAFSVVTFCVSIFLNLVLKQHSPITDVGLWRNYLTFWCDGVSVASLGIVLFYILQPKALLSKIRPFLSTSLLLSSLVFIVFMIIDRTDYVVPSYIIAVVFLIIMLTQSIRESKILVNPVFSLLGKYSYGMYLFHIMIYASIIKYLPALKHWMVFLLVIVVSLLLSIFLNKYFEKPIQNKLNLILAKKA